VRRLLDGIRRQTSAVGRRQAAHAVGTLLGEGEAIYALLAHEDFARDAAIARLFEELQRHVRGVEGAGDLPHALEAYLAEEFVRCAAILAATGHAVHAAPSTWRSAGAVECNLALQQIATFRTRPMPIELVLLAWCALRGAVAA
jgi:hypothetical protein